MTSLPSSTNNIPLLTEQRAKAEAERREFRREVLVSSEGQEMVQEKIDEIRAELTLVMKQYEDSKKALATCKRDDIWIWEFNIEDAEKRLKSVRSKLNKWLRLSTTGWRPVGERQSFDLDMIKQIPIGDIMPYPPSYTGQDRATYRCVAHNEKTASMVWYKEQNTWYCFGCQDHGDVIDCYQHLNKVDFLTACRELTNS